MTGSTRIKGDKLALSFGGTEFWADHTKYELDNEAADGGKTTFADAAAGGGRQFFLSLAAIQSTQAASFWRFAWANTGNVVAYRLAPHGNAVASPDEPHFVGTVKIGAKPKIGGEASEDGEFDFEIRWDCQEEPTLDVGTDGEPIITQITPEGETVGEQVIIAGSRFTGATAVKFAAVDATDFTVVSDQTIVAIIPAGTGAKNVTVITPDGTSNAVSYTVAAS
jgi:hypothetical protein